MAKNDSWLKEKIAAYEKENKWAVETLRKATKEAKRASDSDVEEYREEVETAAIKRMNSKTKSAIDCANDAITDDKFSEQISTANTTYNDRIKTIQDIYAERDRLSRKATKDAKKLDSSDMTTYKQQVYSATKDYYKTWIQLLDGYERGIYTKQQYEYALKGALSKCKAKIDEIKKKYRIGLKNTISGLSDDLESLTTTT